MLPKDQPVFLVGFSSVGKTSVARHLSTLLGCPMKDTDQAIEAMYHTSVSNQIKACGIDKFRKREKATLLRLIGEGRAVIATGGGLPAHEDCMDLMLKHGVVVFLQAPAERITERLMLCKASRPLVADLDEEALARYVQERLPLMERFYSRAPITVDASSMATEADEKRLASRICSLLGQM